MKLTIIVCIVPLYPVFWALTAWMSYHYRGKFAPVGEIARVLNQAIRDEWHGRP